MEVIRITRSTPRARLTPRLETRRRSKKTPTKRKSPQTNNNNIEKPTKNSNAADTIDVIESSQELKAEFLIERDTCQMSPLLFDSSNSNTDFHTSTPFTDAVHDLTESPMTISDSPIPNNQECAKKPASTPTTPKTPTTSKSIADKVNRRTTTPRSARRMLLLKRTQYSSDPTFKYDHSSDSELSATNDSPPMSTPRTPRSRKTKMTDQTIANDSTKTPRKSPRSANSPGIATRSKVRIGQSKIHSMHPPRPKQANKPVAKPKNKPTPNVESSLETIPSDNATSDQNPSQPERLNKLGDSESSALVESLPVSERPQFKRNGGGLDFNLSVRLESSQEVQIIEHKNVIISLTSSGETSSDRRDREKQKNDKLQSFCFEKSAFGQSPDLFDTFEDDKAAPELPRRKNIFMDNRHISFFDRLGVPRPTTSFAKSTPLRKKREIDTSIDMFGDNATTFGETRRHIPIEPIIEPKVNETRTSNANSSSVFEITRNDVFSNLLRVNSDSDMSPIKMSDDELASSGEQLSPRKRPPCLEGLHIQRRTPSKLQSKENISDSDALDTGIIAATPHEQTPQKKLSLYERLCRSDPQRKVVHRKQKPGQTTTGSQGSPDRRRKKAVGSTMQSPDHRKKRMTKVASDERLNKNSTWTGRRLDDYFKKAGTSTNTATEQKPATQVAVPKETASAFTPKMTTFQLLVLSSDDEEA